MLRPDLFPIRFVSKFISNNRPSSVRHSWSARPLVAALLALTLTRPAPALAQGGPAEAVSAGAAVAGVVVSVIGGLSSWVNDQDDDCAAAALAAAWGKDCDLKQKEHNVTGYYSAEAKAEATNACAESKASAKATEGVLGAWASCTIEPKVEGKTFPLHPECGDNHQYKSWAKASVDGESKAETASSPAPAPTLPGLEGPSASSPWPAGTVLAIATIDTLTLNSGKAAPDQSVFKANLRINGKAVWSVSAQLDKAGKVTTTGPLSPRQFRVMQDITTGKFTARLIGYRQEIPVDTLAFAVAGPGLHPLASGGATETTVSVSMDAEVSADGDTGGSALCSLPVDVTCTEATTLNSDGTWKYVGQVVNVLGNLTVANIAETFPTLRMTLTDGLGSLLVVDPFHPTDAWKVGDRVKASGDLALWNEEPVLTRTKFAAAGGDPLPIDPKPIEGDRGGHGRTGVILDQNAPNPFNPTTTIRFRTAAPGPVSLEVYSIAGQLVRRLMDGPVGAGSHEVVWDGRNGQGLGMPSGIYFYRLTSADQSIVRRMIMSK